MDSTSDTPAVKSDGKPRTDRGWRIYVERERPEHEHCWGKPGKFRVVESSIAFMGAHVYVFLDDDAVHLNVPECKLLVLALQEFVNDAEADVLTEPALVTDYVSDEGS